MTVAEIPETEVAQKIVDGILRVLAEQGTRIDVTRGEAILADFQAEVQRAVRRVVLRLEAAARACEAVDVHRGRLEPCKRPAETLRDGRRACGRHARAHTARWALLG